MRTIHVIINPAAGRAIPVLHTLNRIFHAFGDDWEVAITKRRGDGERLARAAVEAGADIVAVYGGDGTVAEVASGLIGSNVPLAILPGGTANVMSVELGIPNDLAGACELFCGDGCETRWVDMGQMADHRPFLLRAGIGFEAEMVQAADREAKDGLGVMAYLLSALNNLRKPQNARYRIRLDGQTVESEGLTCIVANSGSLGRPGLQLVPNVDVSDGLLDVIVVRRADLAAMLAFTAQVTGIANAEPVTSTDTPEEVNAETQKRVQHWQAKEIEIESEPVQPIQSDGEMVGDTPVRCKVLPRAVQILVPATAPSQADRPA